MRGACAALLLCACVTTPEVQRIEPRLTSAKVLLKTPALITRRTEPPKKGTLGRLCNEHTDRLIQAPLLDGTQSALQLAGLTVTRNKLSPYALTVQLEIHLSLCASSSCYQGRIGLALEKNGAPVGRVERRFALCGSVEPTQRGESYYGAAHINRLVNALLADEMVKLALFSTPKPRPAKTARGPTLAVMGLLDRTGAIDPRDRLSLRRYLAVRMTGREGFKVVPVDQLRERLREKKRESYEDCFDAACQIELSREASAERVLTWEVEREAGVCVLTLSLTEVSPVVTKLWARRKADCTSEGLMRAIDQL